MAYEVVKTAKTVDEAIQMALEDLGCLAEDMEYEILAEPAKGLFGILGARDARVKARIKAGAREAESMTETENETKDGAGVRGSSKPDSGAVSEAGTRSVRSAGFTGSPSSDAADKTGMFIADVTKLMGIEAEILMKKNEEAVIYTLNGPKMGTVIGRRGETLDAIQYLSNIVAGKDRTLPRKRIIVDAEDYRQRREDTLVRLASRLASRAKRSGRRVVLEPMNPQERRIIHTALEKDPDVKSISEGEEPYRRLVIYPADSIGRESGGNGSRGGYDRDRGYGRGNNRRGGYTWGRGLGDSDDDDDDE
jgi:spoIIIJ-associated protein